MSLKKLLPSGPKVNFILKRSPQEKNRGITLIEVMITLLVLSVGLLGVALMMWSSQTRINATYINQQAYMATTSILEQMRANASSVPNKDYDLPQNAVVNKAVVGNCQSSNCQPKDLALMEKNTWLQAIQTNLPGGSASITSTPLFGNTKVSIVITWTGRVATNATTAKNIQVENKAQSFTMTTLF